jgi:Ser/Thr protein kinase RdoA (MazF antagonist)
MPESAPLRRVTGSRTNAVWLVGDPPRFVLRRYDGIGIKPARIELQHEVMRYLASRSTLVAAPLAQAAVGKTYIERDGRYWALFPFICGTPGNPTSAATVARATAVALSRALGQQHRLLADFRPAGERLRVDAISALETCRKAAPGFHATDTFARIDWLLFASVCGAAQGVLERYIDELPRHIVHGDMHPANTIWHDGEVAGIIDFDSAHETERIYDLATIIDSFARPSPSGRVDGACAAAMLEAYDETAALSEAERRSIGAMLVRRAATGAIEAQIDYERRERNSAMFMARMIEAYDTWL